MTRTYTVRTAMLLLAVAAIGCQESRPASPTAASLFLPSIPRRLEWTNDAGGDERRRMRRERRSELLAEQWTWAQSRWCRDGADLLATMTMESTGLACRYTVAPTSGANLTMNATSCDRTGLIVQCVGGARELRLVGSSVIGIVERQSVCRRSRPAPITCSRRLRVSKRCRVPGCDPRLQRHAPVSGSVRSSRTLMGVRA